MLGIYIEILIPIIKKCRSISQKNFKINFLKYDLFLKNVLLVTDNIITQIKIYELANLVELDLYDYWVRTSEFFCRFD